MKPHVAHYNPLSLKNAMGGTCEILLSCKDRGSLSRQGLAGNTADHQTCLHREHCETSSLSPPPSLSTSHKPRSARASSASTGVPCLCQRDSAATSSLPDVSPSPSPFVGASLQMLCTQLCHLTSPPPGCQGSRCHLLQGGL